MQCFITVSQYPGTVVFQYCSELALYSTVSRQCSVLSRYIAVRYLSTEDCSIEVFMYSAVLEYQSAVPMYSAHLYPTSPHALVSSQLHNITIHICTQYKCAHVHMYGLQVYIVERD